jgi:hypothetical protein
VTNDAWYRLLVCLLLPTVFIAYGGVGRAEEEPSRKVSGVMQARPGGPMEQVEVGVWEVPTDLPSVAASEAPLKDDDLVLGVVVEGQAMAYPIRYLALYEVVDHRVGETPLAPTW